MWRAALLSRHHDGRHYQLVYTYLFPGANMGFWNITYGFITGKGIAEGMI